MAFDCPDCHRDLERGDRERYSCVGCGRQWVRIGVRFEPDDAIPAARVVKQAPAQQGNSLGPRSACCNAILDDAGVEKSACSACGQRYVRVGITLVPE